MQYEDKVRTFVWAHRECGKTQTVTRVAGAGIPSREISTPADIAELAALVSQNSIASPRTSLHLNLFPANNERYGIYLDLDPVLRSKERLVSTEATRSELDNTLLTVASGFLKLYITNLAQLHLDREAKPSVEGIQKDFPFQALYSGRPVLEEREKDGETYCYKHGCHVHIGEIQAFQTDHILSFNKAASYFDSPAADGTEVVRLLRDRYHIPRDKIKDVFDPNITASRSILLPGCRKKDGHVTYFPTRVINYTLSLIGKTAFIHEDGVRNYNREPLLRYFPVHIGKEAFEVESTFSLETIALPAAIEDPDIDSMEEEAFIEEAKMRNDSVAHLILLLKVLPFDKITDKSTGHDFRLKLVNAVVYEIKPETERVEWARRILKWAFNRQPHPAGVEWHTTAHIDSRVEEAVNDGKKTGIAWIKKEAALVDQDRVHEIDELFRSRNISDLLHRLHLGHSKIGIKGGSVINHQEAADLFSRVLGDNYREFSGNNARDREWYRYTDDAKPHFSCKKWRKVPDIKATVMYDIKNTINPILDKLARESKQGDIQTMMATSTTFDQYVWKVKDILGGEGFVNGLITHLASYYVFSGSEFARDLDMQYDLTGCLNGIMKFEKGPFRAVLLNGNNRDLPVSRSVDASYRTDFSDDSPAVMKVMEIFSQVIPNRSELDYLLTAAAGIILSGRCGGEKFYILYGSGGDGKTTIMNALVSLAGKNTANGFRGYGVEGDPRIFQYEKRDPNGHDGGSYFLYGGPRIGNFPEPSGEHPYLVESVIKSKLSGSSQPTRDLNQSSQILEFRVVPFVLTNDQLEFKGTVTVGGQRRIVCAIFTEKFKPISEMAKYRNKKGFHPIDPSLVGIFTRGSEGKDLREALLWILATKYLPIFYDKCNADINSIPLPTRYEKITASFFGRHSNIMVAFMNAKMELSEGAIIPMAEFMTVFTLWHHTTQRGSIRDLNPKKQMAHSAGPDPLGPAVRDPWTHEVMHIISSSPLGSDMVVKEEDGTYNPIGPNEMIMANSACLGISGWKWRKTDASLLEAAASTAVPAPDSTAAPTPTSTAASTPASTAAPATIAPAPTAQVEATVSPTGLERLRQANVKSEEGAIALLESCEPVVTTPLGKEH
jgi:hypothetical protein